MTSSQRKKARKKRDRKLDLRRIVRKNELVRGISLGFLIAIGGISLMQHTMYKVQKTHGSAPEVQEQEMTPDFYEAPGRSYSVQIPDSHYIEL